jgi:hypothetical protein
MHYTTFITKRQYHLFRYFLISFSEVFVQFHAFNICLSALYHALCIFYVPTIIPHAYFPYLFVTFPMQLLGHRSRQVIFTNTVFAATLLSDIKKRERWQLYLSPSTAQTFSCQCLVHTISHFLSIVNTCSNYLVPCQSQRL